MGRRYKEYVLRRTRVWTKKKRMIAFGHHPRKVRIQIITY